MFRCQERSTEPVWRFGPSQRRPGNLRRVREQDRSAARLDLLRHLAGPHHLARSREPSAWRLHHNDCDCVRPCGEQKSRTTKNWNLGQLLGDGGRGILRSKKRTAAGSDILCEAAGMVVARQAGGEGDWRCTSRRRPLGGSNEGNRQLGSAIALGSSTRPSVFRIPSITSV